MRTSNLNSPYRSRRREESYRPILYWATAIPLAMAMSKHALADYFDPNMLWGELRHADLSRFELDNPAPVGEWVVDVFLNGRPIGKQNIEFAASSKKEKIEPCLTKRQIELLDLNDKLLPVQLLEALKTEPKCIKLQDFFADSKVTFDYSTQSLELSIPQIFTRNLPQDYISPQLYDSGITAARLNYSLSNYHSKSNDYSSNYLYAGLDTTLNYEKWRLRHIGNYSSGGNVSGKYNSLRTYLQRDVFNSTGQLEIGENYSDGTLFESYSLEGVSLNSDARSLPASQLYFSPVIEGVAESNAQVVVSQGGSVIYSRTVPPGPFSLSDVTGYHTGQDLDVVIIEADGSQNSFSIPVNSAATLLRPGQLRYTSSFGKVSSQGYYTEYTPLVGQLTGTYGLNNTLTIYAGTLFSEDYHAFGVGSSFSTSLGAVTGEVVMASNDLLGDQGASFKLAYSTYVEPSGTYLNVATYRYSTHGYWSFNDALANENYRQGYRPENNYLASTKAYGINQRMRFDLSLNQSLPRGWGGLYMSASKTLYWDSSIENLSYQFGYRNNWRGLTYGLNVGRSYFSNPGYLDEPSERNTYTLSVSMPLGNEGRHSIRSSAQLLDDSQSFRTGISGMAGNQQEMSYGADISRSSYDERAPYNSLSVNGGYATAAGQANASFSTGTGGYEQYSLGFNGGILAHEDGLILGQTMGETIGLLHAENAEGASLVSAPGAKVNGDGYALIPHLSPYRRNRVELDPKGLPYQSMLEVSSTEVIPAAGAVVKVDMQASHSDVPFLIELKYVDGRPLPLGSEVLEQSTGKVLGYVGQRGRALLTGLSDKGSLFVEVDRKGTQCVFDYAQTGDGSEKVSVLKGVRQLDVKHCEVFMLGQSD